MKKMLKLLIVILILIILFADPVFAKSEVVIENIKLVNISDDLKDVNNEKIDVSFNSLGQFAEYEVTLKNNTDKDLFVKDFKTESLSNDFLIYVLDEDSIGKEFEKGKTNSVKVVLKTLDIANAGKNFNNNVNLKVVFEEKIKNASTSTNSTELILSLALIAILLLTYFNKKNKKAILVIMIVGILSINTISVMAEDAISVSITGDVKYTSQNLLEESGISLVGYSADYSNAKDIWKYYDKIKTITINSSSEFKQEYEKEFDLSKNNNGKVKGYLVKTDNVNMYDLYIVSKGMIYAPVDSTALFSFPNVEKIIGLENIVFDETRVFKGMFFQNEKLEEVNVDSIDFSQASDTSYMFMRCYELEIEPGKIKLPSKTNSAYMFTNYLYDEVAKNSVTDKNTNFSATPIAGKYLMESTKNDKFPIYYYRGNVDNNNVIFANFCWKIVRTTESGGIKLVYNGTPNSKGSCNNSKQTSQIGTTIYSDNTDTITFGGYMYETNHRVSYKNLSSQDAVYVYGNDVKWDGSNYTLKDSINSDLWKDDRTTIATKYHYTCFNSTGVCDKVYYVTYFGGESGVYYLTLENGKKIDDAKKEIFINKTDSSIKSVVDNWYASNMTNYTELLEDTVFCNDRTFYNGSLKGKDVDAGIEYSFYGARISALENGVPRIACDNKNDSFSVNDSKGNGALTYPVGLLTADEVILAGAGQNANTSSSYLNTGVHVWTMTPAYTTHKTDLYYRMSKDGNISYAQGSKLHGVRPSVSLKSGIDYVSGTGTVSDPYIVVE